MPSLLVYRFAYWRPCTVKLREPAVMETNNSLEHGHSQLAIWHYFEGYNPPAEETRRLAEQVERLAGSTTWSFDQKPRAASLRHRRPLNCESTLRRVRPLFSLRYPVG